jgi:hypothetical protein
VDRRNAENLVAALRRQIAGLEDRARPAAAPLASGCAALDALLPAGGFRPGTLVEWLAAAGGGAASLALRAGRAACDQGGALVVLDRARQFYPPAAVRLGLDPQQLILVRAATAADELWALDQALRCVGVAAALAWPERLGPKTFRRLQLAAEIGGGLGLLVRPEAARREPTWADVRLWVESLPPAAAPTAEAAAAERGGAGRRLRITILHCRGGAAGRRLEVETADDSHPLRVLPG